MRGHRCSSVLERVDGEEAKMAVQIEMPEPQSPTKHADGDGDDRKAHCRCVLNYTPHLRTVRTAID